MMPQLHLLPVLLLLPLPTWRVSSMLQSNSIRPTSHCQLCAHPVQARLLHSD